MRIQEYSNALLCADGVAGVQEVTDVSPANGPTDPRYTQRFFVILLEHPISSSVAVILNSLVMPTLSYKAGQPVVSLLLLLVLRLDYLQR